MAVYRAVAAIGLGGSVLAGLRPVPQGVRTQAAGAAPEANFDLDARVSGKHVQGVFGRHSTQSSIAGRLRPDLKEFKALLVDTAVYGDAGAVYKSSTAGAQVPEYAPRAAYTVHRPVQVRRE